MLRIFAPLIAVFGYSAASTMGYVPNMWGPAVGKLYSFNYEKADNESRRSFLFAQASNERSVTNKQLAGSGYSISEFELDTDRRRVTFLWRYPRNISMTKASIRSHKSSVLRETCKPWSQTSMGEAGVSWRFSYRDVRNQEVGSILINPGTCYNYI